MSRIERTSVLVFSLALACLVAHFILADGIQPDVIWGWAAGSAVMALCAGLGARAACRTQPGLNTLALVTIFARLFSLIILIVIVLVGGFLRLEPFITGLLSTYFIGSWIEIRALLRNVPEAAGGDRSIDKHHGGSGNHSG